jgi:hypothetical protein
MKRTLVVLAVLVCVAFFLVGCSGQKAEKEYKRILDAELHGGEPNALITQYQALISQYPDTSSATRAQERLIALKTKIENDAKAAQLKAQQEERVRSRKAEQEQKERELKGEQEEKERKLKAEQLEKESIQKHKDREVLEEEVKRQAPLLGEEMALATKKAALKLHADTDVTEMTLYGEPKSSEDWEKKIWTVSQTYIVKLKGRLLGLSTYSEIIECRGEIRLNEVTKQFERTVSAKPAATK